jgi:hypothetical protein
MRLMMASGVLNGAGIWLTDNVGHTSVISSDWTIMRCTRILLASMFLQEYKEKKGIFNEDRQGFNRWKKSGKAQRDPMLHLSKACCTLGRLQNPGTLTYIRFYCVSYKQNKVDLKTDFVWFELQIKTFDGSDTWLKWGKLILQENKAWNIKRSKKSETFLSIHGLMF